MVNTGFAAILKELQEKGLNDYKMAALTGIERTKLSRLRTGEMKQPAYDDGIEIMKVYVAKDMKRAK